MELHKVRSLTIDIWDAMKGKERVEILQAWQELIMEATEPDQEFVDHHGGDEDGDMAY